MKFEGKNCQSFSQRIARIISCAYYNLYFSFKFV